MFPQPLKSNFSTIRFYNIRRHIFNKAPYVSRKHLDSSEIYERKQISRLKREAQIISETEREEFFQWIEEIQITLGLDNYKLAKRLKVTAQTVKLWKRRKGHYPCSAAFERLLILEKEAMIAITDVYVILELAA